MNARQVFRVASYEYRTHVRRPGFLFFMFGFPLFTLLIGFGLIAMVHSELREHRASEALGLRQPVAVIDKAGILPERLPSPFVLTSDIEQGKEEIRKGNYLALVIIPQDYDTAHEVTLVVTRGLFSLLRLHEATTTLMAYAELQGRYTLEEVQRLIKGPEIRIVYLDTLSEFNLLSILAEEEVRSAVRLSVGFLLAILYGYTAMLSAGYLMQGIRHEKNNRIIEILLSSLTSTELLWGKVMGLSALGLTQFIVWSLLTGLTLSILIPRHILLQIFSFIFHHTDFQLLLIFLIITPLSYLAFAFLAAGVGAVWDYANEILPFFALPIVVLPPVIFLLDPRHPIQQVLSYLSLTGPTATLLRWSLDPLPWWELGLITLIVLLSTLGSVWVSVRLFRVGVLLYAKKPSWREIWHIVRHPA